MHFARFQGRLLANYTFPLYFPDYAVRIINKPVAAQQLHRVFGVVFNVYFVRKNKMRLRWTRVFGLVLSDHANFYSLCYGCYHGLIELIVDCIKGNFYLYLNEIYSKIFSYTKAKKQITYMDVKIAESWKVALKSEFEKPYFTELVEFVRDEYKSQRVYPPGRLMFNAFDKCAFDNLRVVILGQDPYHGMGQANGLSFSVNDGVRIPPSLQNIFKEIEDDLGKPAPRTGNLERWAEQGVLMLNATLTVREGQPGSHQQKGWEVFTDAVIQLINDQKEGVVFMLWGKYAQDKGKIIDTTKHFVLKAKHPSPMAANYGGWFGCQHFSQANNYLVGKGLAAINW